MNDPDDGKEVRIEIQIAASPETVFALLTDPARMQTWLADLVDADCRRPRLRQLKLAAEAAERSKTRK
jgi:uncharacterized protein YndB with AHSA1/START domain